MFATWMNRGNHAALAGLTRLDTDNPYDVRPPCSALMARLCCPPPTTPTPTPTSHICAYTLLSTCAGGKHMHTRGTRRR